MSAEEKDAALHAFAAGDTRVLISTTVVEVGIDVPDATFMVIENADRYGLSQLHQLRGRVGRGEKQSYCYLFSSPGISENGIHRLKTITGSTDGFQIAETDLQMRGGGIITGLSQSGYLDFKVGCIEDHHNIFVEARRDAVDLLKEPETYTSAVAGHLERIEARLKDINFS